MRTRKHNRQSIRLKGYDYRRAGTYFVTICTHHHACIFGQIDEGRMQLNNYGRIALSRWRALPRFFPRLRLDAFVVMPNHVHGILILKPPRIPVPGTSHDINTGNGRGDASAGIDGRSRNRHPATENTPFPDVGDASPLQTPRPIGTASGSIGAIVQNFKSTATRRINKLRKTPGSKVWQRNYHERILWDNASLERVRQYIDRNPARWGENRK